MSISRQYDPNQSPDYWIGIAKDWQLSGYGPAEQLISLDDEMLKTHLLAIGGTGSGKTTLFLNLIYRDIMRGRSVVVFDPRGDFCGSILNMCAAAGVHSDRIKYLDLGEKERPHGFDPLSGRGAHYFKALNVYDVLEDQAESWGTLLAETIRCGLLLLAEAKQPLARFEQLFYREDLLEEWLSVCTNDSVIACWQRFKEMSEERRVNMILSVMNKMSLLFSTETMMKVLSHPNPIDFGSQIDRPGSITLVSLAIHELHKAARMMGAMLLSHISREIFSRVDQLPHQRNPVRLYVDEFEHYVTEDFETILAESRRFNCSCCLAHQTLSQLTPRMRSLVLNNVGVKFAFRCSNADALTLCKDISVDPKDVDLNNMPPGEALMWVRGYEPEVVELNEPIKEASQFTAQSQALLEAIYKDSPVTKAPRMGLLKEVTGMQGERIPEPRYKELSKWEKVLDGELHDGPRSLDRQQQKSGQKLGSNSILKVVEPGKQLTKSCSNVDAPTFPVFELLPTEASIRLFQRSASAALASHGAIGSCASVPNGEECKKMRLFLTKDCLAGFTIKNGRISSLFNHRDDSVRGKFRCLVGIAVQEGGWAIDVFDTILPHMYGDSGFKAVCRSRWIDKFAPKNWNYDEFNAFNLGRPDVVYMVHDPNEPQYYMPGEGAYVESHDAALQIQHAAHGLIQSGKRGRTNASELVGQNKQSRAMEDWLCD
jgi:hypothetical protein